MRHRIRAVLFDLDGTLLDRRETLRRHLELQIERHSGLFSQEEAGRYVSRLLELDENGSLDRGQFYHRAQAEFGLEPDSATTLLEDFERNFPETCVPLPHVSECLTALRRMDLKLGLVTNGRELIQRRKIQGLRLEAFLDTIVISESVGHRKPDPRIFERALAELGERPSSAVHVGDDPEADVEGAKRAGLLSIWRRDSFWQEPEGADLVIEDLSEIPGWLTVHRAPAADQ